MRNLGMALGCTAWAVVLSLGVSGAGGGDALEPFAKRKLSTKAELVTDARILSRALWDISADAWKPAANEEKTRGPAATVYPIAAPAVVVVRTDKGHGTGAFIDPAGWVLTNHHVIADATIDTESGARQAMIFMGHLKDGIMEPDKTGQRALVYKSNPEKDLALLRIQATPGSTQKFPALKLAAKVPPPGKECVAIGHPGSGLLWTVRSGEISGIGQWPRDMTELLALRLSASPRQRDEIQAFLAKSPQRKIVLSNCGINFGDSGGPLLNPAGELIAVTFAMPKKGYEGTAPFAYHVHLDEVKEFLEKRPAEPLTSAPDPWPAGIYQELLDLDGDGIPDALALSKERGGPLTGMLLDLRQENKVRSVSDLGSNVRTTWRFQVAIHFQPQLTVYYDTDLDGTVDLVLTEKEPRGPVQVRRLDKGRWRTEDNVRRPLLDPTLFQNADVRNRLARIIQRTRSRTN